MAKTDVSFVNASAQVEPESAKPGDTGESKMDPELYKKLIKGYESLKYLKDQGREWEYKPESRHVYMSEDGMFLYFLGIIDYLQDFNFDKKFENKFKSNLPGVDGKLISAVPPKDYASRYFNFMQKHVIINQNNVNAITNSKLRIE